MASEYYDQPKWLTSLQQIANFIFTAAFTMEMLIKMFGLGLFKYFDDNFNSFDCSHELFGHCPFSNQFKLRNY
jgi:hypothetical protein